MWDWILKIFDFIRALLSKHADNVKEQAAEDKALDEQRGQIEAEVNKDYDTQEQQVPSDGADLVDYWDKRGGLQSGNQPPDQPTSKPKGRTKSS